MELLEQSKFYHIYNHVNGNENLFKSDENYNYFLKKYSHYINPIAFTYAYCLMPNHLHLLIKTKAIEEIGRNIDEPVSESIFSNSFSNLFNSYTKAFNIQQNRKGSLFNPRFKRKQISNPVFLKNVVHYIHYNPVNHGFCKNLEDWPHSSFHSLISAKPTKLNREAVLQWFDNSAAFKVYHSQTPDPKYLIDFETW